MSKYYTGVRLEALAEITGKKKKGVRKTSAWTTVGFELYTIQWLPGNKKCFQHFGWEN
jgi:hypothetical protein